MSLTASAICRAEAVWRVEFRLPHTDACYKSRRLLTWSEAKVLRRLLNRMGLSTWLRKEV